MILVTGADGFLGGEVFRFLKSSGTNVCGTSLRKQKGMICVDITKPETLKNLPKKINTVIHLAARLSSSEEERARPEVAMEECLRVNAEGTLNLLKHVKGIKHFIYISTGSVYGSIERPTETDCPKPDTWYALSKYVGEIYSQEFCMQNSTGLTILRLGSLFGANQRRFFVYNILESVNKNYDITIYGTGETKLDLVYVKDVVEVIKCVVQRRVCGVFNIGSGRPTSVREVAEVALEVFGKSGLRIICDKTKSENRVPLMNVDKAKKELNLKLRFDVKRGFLDIKKEGHAECF